METAAPAVHSGVGEALAEKPEWQMMTQMGRHTLSPAHIHTHINTDTLVLVPPANQPGSHHHIPAKAAQQHAGSHHCASDTVKGISRAPAERGFVCPGSYEQLGERGKTRRKAESRRNIFLPACQREASAHPLPAPRLSSSPYTLPKVAQEGPGLTLCRSMLHTCQQFDTTS